MFQEAQLEKYLAVLVRYFTIDMVKTILQYIYKYILWDELKENVQGSPNSMGFQGVRRNASYMLGNQACICPTPLKSIL